MKLSSADCISCFHLEIVFAQLSLSLPQSDTWDNYAKTCMQKRCIHPQPHNPTPVTIEHQRQQSRPCQNNACIKSYFMYIARLFCLPESTCGGGIKRKKQRSENGRRSLGSVYLSVYSWPKDWWIVLMSTCSRTHCSGEQRLELAP